MDRTFHNPPHIYLDNAIYIVTACTYGKKPYFDANDKKKMLMEKIFNSIDKIGAKLYAWVILTNHYHILFEIFSGKNLGRLIKLINGSSSRELNRIDNTSLRKIWFNYWDTCIRTERDFYMRLNYIHNNPIKHGYIKDYSELMHYAFSSYPIYLKEKGQEYVEDLFRKYPIKDFTEKGEP